MKVVIYGTGAKALKFAPSIGIHFALVGFMESKEPADKLFLSKPVYMPEELSNIDFDKIIICSSFADDINAHLKTFNYTDSINVDALEEVKNTAREIVERNNEIEKQKIAKMDPIPLASRHISNVRLLPTRQELLTYLPTGSIGAEIGVSKGDFTLDIIKTVAPKKLHLVDVWATDRYGESQYQLVNQRFKSQIETGICNIHRGMSTTRVDDFDDNYFDWVYIDTDHSYATTLSELEKYSEKVKIDGLILGHDYCMGNWNSRYKYGVIEAIYKFCNEYDYEILFLTMELSQSFAIKKI